jgi:hypothetical protein
MEELLQRVVVVAAIHAVIAVFSIYPSTNILRLLYY